MHAGCFLVWGEACMLTIEHNELLRSAPGATGVTPVDEVAVPLYTLRPQTFCQTRLQMLTDRVRDTNKFADAVRRMRKSRTGAARAACEQARRQSRLTRAAYNEHLRDHGCCAARGPVPG